ncbi:Endoplasmin [Orchesella cincta]|uniref:Heat shock protein 83 n=1 Tax=Orchesella cincta TaxID=48709 RepID=A0A1D2MVN8_ORCCI|nr:Endoplasmin [Orchesella cincta]
MPKIWVSLAVLLLIGLGSCKADLKYDSEGEEGVTPKVNADLGTDKEGSRTDDGVVQREEEAIKLDGLNVAQIKELRDKAEKFQFQAEVNRMMKLIINSLYKNKEIFLRELISNASDALDKLRLLSLTDGSVLDATNEQSIRIRVDKESRNIHITDTGIGMTKEELVKNLGTIAKSGTSDFLEKMQSASDTSELTDLIGQFGVGFYSAFLVADRVVVTSKANEDKQYIWESDASSFSIADDPRGDTLKRGTQVTLQMKPEALNYLEDATIRDLVKKYSQFIQFPIYFWAEKTVEEEVPADDVEEKKEKKEDEIEDDDDAKVEDKADDDKPKTKKVSKTVYDWELINDTKPIWTRKPNQVEDKEYEEFYKTLTKDYQKPLAHTHFIAEGEVTFKALLFVPAAQPSENFNRYGTRTDHIKLYVRRVFITDDFQEMMPNYLSFVRGVVDSDDLPLNVSRETLQQNKLIKVIRKKLIRKTLDMLKKLEGEDSEKFWKEYSTNIKLGVIEDTANKSRLAKLLRFQTSGSPQGTASLTDYVSRMKDKQEAIYYMAGSSREEVEKSPFVERLLKKGFEVIYLTEAVDEYCIGALPEFEGKKFQNVAKEGLTIADGKSKEKLEETKKIFDPLTKWLGENALKDQILKAVVSERLDASPCALVTSQFGWTGNMERIILSQTHSKANDVSREYYLNQKKTMEINPRHPLIKELLRRINDDVADPVAKETALTLFRTATLRSGYMLKDTTDFAETVEKMMRQTLGVPMDEEVEDEEDIPEDEPTPEEDAEGDDQGDGLDTDEHDEL